MSPLESYLFLFFDSFFANFIFSFQNEMVVKLLLVFEGYNKYLVFVLAFLGSFIGSIANFFIGRYFKFLRKTNFLLNKQQEIAKAEIKWDRYLVWLLLFSWFSFIGNSLSVLAGFLNTSFKKFITLVFIGKFAYYLYFFWPYF